VRRGAGQNCYRELRQAGTILIRNQGGAERLPAAVSDGPVRCSVSIEDARDLRAGLDRALEAV